jgi:hypothetical protein
MTADFWTRGAWAMPRKIVLSLVVPVLVLAGALASAPPAGAATTTQLLMSQGAAFAVLRYDCGGIHEHVYATGFASNGYPTGAAHLETTCASGGRGGGHFTVRAWASVTWTWYGETRGYAKLAEEPAGLSTSFSAEDSYGDRLYNTETAAYLETTSPPIMPPAPPTNVSAYAYRTGEEGESGPQRFSVSWSPAPETAALVTSSTVTARPVGSSAPTLTTTVTGGASGVQLGTAEPNTTYLITVTSTDSEGTSAESSPPDEVTTLTPVALVAPIAITEAATAVTETTATLEGYVNPAGEPVEVCEFEYGTTEAYGGTVPCSSLPGEGETPIPVSAAVSGLITNATYHYRLVARGPGGAGLGADQSFTTSEPLPVIMKIKPNSGPVDGGTSVVITGTNLAGTSGVDFGAVEATSFHVNSATSVTAIAPPQAAGVVDISVTTLGGTSAVTTKDRYKYTPTITELEPNTGSTAGGTLVTVRGTGFEPGTSATLFKFGTSKGTGVDCTSSTECTVMAPAHAAGAVDVTATVNKTVSPKTSSDKFTYG